MPRWESGWFKVWREAWHKDLSRNVYLWALWHALLHMAHWKESQTIWNGDRRTLPPGTVIFGIKEIANRWNCSQRTISKWLHYLHKTDRIVLETCARGTLVTIRNWEKYQKEFVDACAESAEIVRAAHVPSRNEVGLKEESKKEDLVSIQKFDLETVYRKYPRKQGKTKGIIRLRKEIRTEDDYRDLIKAVEHYRSSGDVQRGFVKLFSSFASEWRDWIDPQTGRVDAPNAVNTIPVPLEEIQ